MQAEDTATLESGCGHSGALGSGPHSTAHGMTSGKKLSRYLQASSPWEEKMAREEREREKERGGIGVGRERKQDTENCCLYCNSSWYDSFVFIFYLWKKFQQKGCSYIQSWHSNQSTWNQADWDLYFFLLQGQTKMCLKWMQLWQCFVDTFYIRFESYPLLTLLCAKREYCTH